MDWLSRELISRQADLSDERQLLERLLLSIDAGVAYVDKDEIYQIVNPQYAEYYNRQPEDFLGKRLFSLVPELEKPYRKLLESVTKKRKPVSVKRIATNYSGSGLRYKDCVFTPILDEDGEVAGTLILSMDVTELVKLEETLTLNAQAIKMSLDAIITSDLNGTILSWNKSAERIYGYEANEVIGTSIAITVPDDKLDEVARNNEAITVGNIVSYYTTNRLRKGGAVFTARLSVSPVRDPNHKIVGVMAIVRDLSEELQNIRPVT